MAGNYLVIEHGGDHTAFTALAHLRQGSIRVGAGDEVTVGQQLAECGNSGNSTQPHVHVQVTDTADLAVARGIPVAFRAFREWPRGGDRYQNWQSGLPAEGAVVEPLPER